MAHNNANQNDNTNKFDNGKDAIINTFYQKLAMLEAALTLTSEFKEELHTSANQASFDIRYAFDKLIMTLRERENELFQQVISLSIEKEEILNGQLAMLNQSIGACKQLLENYQNNLLDETTLDVCSQRFNLDKFQKNPLNKNDMHIMFDDSSLKIDKLLQITSTFGRIKERKISDVDGSISNWLSRDHQNNNAFSVSSSISSSPITQIDEQQQLEHLRNRVTSTASSFDVIGNYEIPTTKTKSQNTFAAHFDELNHLPIDHWLKPPVAVPKNINSKPLPLISKQFEINSTTKNQRKLSYVSGNENQELDRYFGVNWTYAESDSSNWLKSNSKLSCTACGVVINSIMKSTAEKWLAPSTDVKFTEKLETPRAKLSCKMTPVASNKRHRSDTLNSTKSSLFSMEEDNRENQFITTNPENGSIEETLKRLTENFETKQFITHNEKTDEDKMECFIADSESLTNTKNPLDLPKDPSHWLKNYPLPKQNRPMNEIAENLSSWESVLGWKGILEKIHASGEDIWLAPSSRAIKM